MLGWDIFRGICTRELISQFISYLKYWSYFSFCVGKKEKNNCKTLNHAWEYSIWWSTQFDGSLWQSDQCLVIAADLLHCIYIWNKTRTIDLFFIIYHYLLLSIWVIQDTLIMMLRNYLIYSAPWLSTTDYFYSHWNILSFKNKVARILFSKMM